MVGVEAAGELSGALDTLTPVTSETRLLTGVVMTLRKDWSFSFKEARLPVVSALDASSSINLLVTADSTDTRSPINKTTNERHPDVLPDDAR